MEVKEITLSEVAQAWKDIAATPAGQICIQNLVHKFGYSRSSTIDVDPLKMAWKEGGRAVCVHVGRMLDMTTQDAIDQSKERGEV